MIETFKRHLGLTMDKLIRCWFDMLVKEYRCFVKEEEGRDDNTAITMKEFTVRSITRRYFPILFNIILFKRLG